MPVSSSIEYLAVKQLSNYNRRQSIITDGQEVFLHDLTPSTFLSTPNGARVTFFRLGLRGDHYGSNLPGVYCVTLTLDKYSTRDCTQSSSKDWCACKRGKCESLFTSQWTCFLIYLGQAVLSVLGLLTIGWEGKRGGGGGGGVTKLQKVRWMAKTQIKCIYIYIYIYNIAFTSCISWHRHGCLVLSMESPASAKT